MKEIKQQKPIILGFGEFQDPMPEFKQTSGFKVFAGACKECGCSGRKLLPSGQYLSLICDRCGYELVTNLKTSQLSEVCYVYWCSKSRFAADSTHLSAADAYKLEAEIKKLGGSVEAPHWAVIIAGGRCVKSDLCLNDKCPYRVKCH